jgi:hypothetical protein
VYGQGWRLGRAVRELGGRVGLVALEIAGWDRRVADAYEELALDYLAAVDLRRFVSSDDEYLIRVATVVIRGAHCGGRGILVDVAAKRDHRIRR